MEIVDQMREQVDAEATKEADLLVIAERFSGPQGAAFAEVLQRVWLDRPSWVPGESHDWGIYVSGIQNGMRWLLEAARAGDRRRAAKEKVTDGR